MAGTPFSVYTGGSLTGLVNSFLGANSGISVVSGSIALNASAADAINFYDGSLAALGIGSGLLVTSGTTPGTSNTVEWFGQDNTVYGADGAPLNFFNGDADIDTVVNTVFQTQSFDATTLSFAFTVTDPAAKSISFDLVFGTDEYPEWVDQFVDCAVIVVNGVNYAYFNHDAQAPLSVIGPNLAAGYFQDNAGNVLPIEYDGVSKVLKIVAPINAGQINTIKIGVADTGDHIYDSGLFISNMVAGTTPGSGVVITPDVPCTNGDDIVTGSVKDELIVMLDGNDVAYAGGGDDIVVAGNGNDKLYGGSGEDVLEGDAGDDFLDGGEGISNMAVFAGNSSAYSVTFYSGTAVFTVLDNGALDGQDTLVNVQLAKFADGLFDLTSSGLVAHSAGSGGGANSASSLVISGAAVVGKTLTAIAIDADGVPQDAATVTYHWLASADGATWSDTGIVGKNLTLTDADAGMQLKVTATFTDNAGHAETPASAPLTIATASGDPLIELMQISAPPGASVANPLTTLLNDAIGLGFSATEASIAIGTALGLPDISLKSYDAYALLSANPADATALQVLKVSTQVAIAASVSDPTGFNLTLAAMDAAANGIVLDLADPAVLGAILTGVDSASLDIVKGLNKDMADAATFAKVVLVWNDYCGQMDNLAQYDGHLDTLNLHINLAPTGFSQAELIPGAQDSPVLIAAADLLAGFSDPEGAALSVTDLFANTGGTITGNGDGTWTFTPDAGFSGPVELGFVVSDPEGGTANGATMLVINAAPDPLDTTAPGVTIAHDAAGTAIGDLTYKISFSEPVSGLSVGDFTVTNGAVTSLTENAGDWTVVVMPSASFEGLVGLTLNAGAVSDAAGNGNDAAVAPDHAVDTRAPDVTGFSPADGVTGVATSANLVVTFSEAIVRGAGSIVIHQGSASGTVVEIFDAAASSRLSLSGAILTIDPLANLAEGTQYFVTFGPGTLQDLAGNAYAGTTTYDFTTLVAAPLNLIGTSGIETLTGGNLDDVLNGLGGVDVLDGRGGSDLYLIASAAEHSAAEIADTGASGIDEVRFTATSSATLTLYANDTGIERVVIGPAPTAAMAAAGGGTSTPALNVDAAAVANGLTIVGDAGANVLTGTAFDDVLVGGAGNDTLSGGSGIDTASYSGSTTGVKVSLGVTKAQDTVAAGKDTLTGIENLIGGAGNDALTGSATANRIDGGAGNDVLLGLGGADALVGGSGADSLTGGAGADGLWGGTGADRFFLTALSDSSTTASDTIWDFNPGEGDRIDLSALDAITGGKDQAFTLVSGFSHSAGQLTVTTEGGHYLLQGDVTGDGLADFSMAIYAMGLITSANLIL